MVNIMSRNKDKVVGFFPLFYNLAETGRSILIAKRLMEMGGKPIFFSHGGKYEYLAREYDYEVIRVDPLYSEEFIRKMTKINRGEQKGIIYSTPYLEKIVREEIKVFKKTDMKLIVSFVNIPCAISARAVGIPLVCVGPTLGNFQLRIPDNYENCFTLLIPQFLKLQILNFYFKRSKRFLKPFNIIAEKYNLKPFKSTTELTNGDVTLGTNFLEFINIFPNQQLFPDEDYIGIISLEELFSDQFEKDNETIEQDIKNHLNKSGGSILLTMGSSGDKELFIKLLQELNKTKYQVIAIYTNILDEKKLPKVNKNILLIKYVKSINELHQMTDLSIIHGGQGTVYSAAYAGKPIIGFPMQFEQHLNIEKMVGHGTGIMLSKKYFNRKNFHNSLREIFDNYETFFDNAQKLANRLPPPKGDKNAANRIIEILNKN